MLSEVKDEGNCLNKCAPALCGKDIEVDDIGQALNFKILSLQRPHMRAFHLSWFGFFLAFTSWFAFAPLMPTVAKDLNLTKSEIGSANIASISSTIIFRFVAGPLCDRFGARRVFAVMLAVGSIPACCAGLISSGTGLIIMRAFIGVIGCVFVPCQMWTTYMFAPSIVGSANAMAGGWGNLGGGFTYILMPQLFSMFVAFGLGDSMAWRVSFLVPGFLCLTTASLMWFKADDYPTPPTSSVHDGGFFAATMAEEKNETTGTVEQVEMTTGEKLYAILGNPAVWVLMVVYGLCFGVELAVNNKIGMYFYNGFKRPNCDPLLVEDECRVLTQSTAGLIASLFGLMNLFARGMGGLASDLLNKKSGVPGRLLVLFITLGLECGFLFIFQAQRTIPTAIVFLVCFSTCVQMSEGATYGVVPYVDKRFTGTIAGIVGAGGNLGGVACATIFKSLESSEAFQIIGTMVGVAAALMLVCKVDGSYLFHFFTSSTKTPARVSTTAEVVSPSLMLKNVRHDRVRPSRNSRSAKSRSARSRNSTSAKEATRMLDAPLDPTANATEAAV